MAGRPPGGSADGKQRLLNACWELLVELPVGERLTIAAVCDRAKCTPPTLYHHFGDLAALERATSRRAYMAWSDEMEAANSFLTDPKQRIVERGHSYLDWALKHPDAYHALFSQPRKTADPQALDDDAPALQSFLKDLAEVRGVPADDPSVVPLAIAYWTGVHGVASLATTVSFYTEDIQEAVLDVITRVFLSPHADDSLNNVEPIMALSAMRTAS